MSEQPLPAARQFQLFSPLTFCVALHIVVAWSLVARPWYLTEFKLLVAIAIPLSQCSLATIWATVSRGNLYLRFLLCFIAIVGCWLVLTQVAGWGIGDAASAGWALMLLVQALGIVVGIQLCQMTQHSARFTFRLKTLMLWMTLSAAVFGFTQFGRAHWQWSASVASWQYIYSMPITGLFNSLIALCCLRLSTLSNRRLQVAGGIIALGTIATASQLVLSLNDWISGDTTLSRWEMLAMAISQFACVWLTQAAVNFGKAE